MTPAAPEVSIIIPVYNCAPYLDATIRSVIGQSWPDWELIAVNDGSTDGSLDILEGWRARDERVRVHSRPNGGRPAFGRNDGIELSRGRLITFLDGDDLFHPSRLEFVVRVLDALPEVGGVFHEYLTFDDGSDPAGGRPYLAAERYFERAKRYFLNREVDGLAVLVGTPDLIRFMSTDLLGIHTSAITVRRCVLEQLGPRPFREDIPHGEDVDLWFRIARATRLACIPEPLSYYRSRPQSWMSTNSRSTYALGSWLVKSDMLIELEKSLGPAERSEYGDAIARYWHAIGYQCLKAGLVTLARQGFLRAFRRAQTPRTRWLAVKGLLTSLVPGPARRLWWRGADAPIGRVA